MEEYTGTRKFNNCFVCSPTNPYGLHLTNSYVNGRSHMELMPKPDMEGLTGLMHGGFSLMLMDEIMYYAVEGIGVDCVTLHSECDFLNPAILDHRMIAEGWVERRDRKKIFTKGELRDAETGKVIVSASGLYYQVDMNAFLPGQNPESDTSKPKSGLSKSSASSVDDPAAAADASGDRADTFVPKVPVPTRNRD